DNDPDLEILVTQKFRVQIRNGSYRFIFVRSGEDALVKLRENVIDVLLTEIKLPGMDGLTLISRLKTEYPLIRSVIISSYGDMRTIRRALNLGAFDFLTKPIDFDDLGITITKTIEEALALKLAVKDRERLTAIRQELDIARRIQLSMIPGIYPAFPERVEFEIFGEIITAREVGGDFYDFCMIDDDRLYFAIGDASGKGVPAALFMAVTRTMIKADAVKGLPPDRCLAEANKILCMENEFSMFITVFTGVLDARNGEITYSNGGHKLPFIIREGSAPSLLENTDGIALGVIEGDSLYGTKRIKLEPGDVILLYSDGVTEAVNMEGRLFTDKKLRDLLGGDYNGNPRDIVGKVLRDVEEFSHSVRIADDVTVLALRYNKI
ncbi:MAG TPA: SpoIIE family protein phosphatase, partial [Thermodesulfobacteriota bacterium]|nr:SpoIIE family protein phosphatase [Thermodesulfobacteriota bacterium]